MSSTRRKTTEVDKEIGKNKPSLSSRRGSVLRRESESKDVRSKEEEKRLKDGSGQKGVVADKSTTRGESKERSRDSSRKDEGKKVPGDEEGVDSRSVGSFKKVSVKTTKDKDEKRSSSSSKKQGGRTEEDKDLGDRRSLDSSKESAKKEDSKMTTDRERRSLSSSRRRVIREREREASLLRSDSESPTPPVINVDGGTKDTVEDSR